MTIITETTLYVVLPFITLLVLVLVIPMVIDHWTTKAKKRATDAEREFLERTDLTAKERRQFIDAESKSERLEVAANVARMRGVYAPIPIHGLSYHENIQEFTLAIIEIKKGNHK